MATTNKLIVAPWIVQEKNVLLGAGLKAVKVPHLHFHKIPTDKLDYLIRNKYVLEKSYLPDRSREVVGYDSAVAPNWIWISEISFLEEALLLKQALSKLNYPSKWQITINAQTILNNLPDDKLHKPFVLRLAHHEPIAKTLISQVYANLITKTQIIWIGESTDGTHLGPIIRTYEDLDNYLLASQTWHFSQQLLEFGFKDYWPLPIHSHLRANHAAVAAAVIHIIRSTAGTCWLIEENREVCLWSNLLTEKVSEATFFSRQFWSKGLIRNFRIEQFTDINSGYITKCRTPCAASDYLEGNSGKGIDTTSAIYSMVGESVERFSAWQANTTINRLSPALQSTVKHTTYTLDQFHPFGAKWENYLASSNIDLPFYQVKNQLCANETCLAPECLIPFPYVAANPQYDATTASTGGLAVYSNYEQAVIKGALELFERNDFYSNFLWQKFGWVLDFSSILTKLNDTLPAFPLLLNHLTSNSIQYWCIIYDLHSKIPIVHCLISDKKNNFFSRGSGSGNSLIEATTAGLAEALQIRQQFLNNATSKVAQGYNDWRKPEVIQKLQTYLGEFPILPFNEHPISSLQHTYTTLLTEIKHVLDILQIPLLVAELPCQIIDWFAVRVLIPGFTSHQYPSQSLGGSKIVNSVFHYAIPT